MVDVERRALGPALATTPEAHGTDDMRFNDGKGAPGGELIIGRMHSKWRDGNPGRLYRRAPPICSSSALQSCRPTVHTQDALAKYAAFYYELPAYCAGIPSGLCSRGRPQQKE